MDRLLIGIGCILLVSCTTGGTIEPGAYQVHNDEIPRPLTQVENSAAEGASVFVNRDSGHCVLCHRVDSIDAPFQGNLGPDLSTVGSRLTPAQLRFRIVDASRLNPHTIMPPYYRTANLTQVAVGTENKPVLNAPQVEQLVYFLASLRGVSE